MSTSYQYPYVKAIKATGEIIPNTDHNKQEIQIEALTDALGNYNFSLGSLTLRVGTLEDDPSFSDSLFRIFDNNNKTKRLALEVENISADTTRTWTVQDISGVVPILEASQTWSGVQTFEKALTITREHISATSNEPFLTLNATKTGGGGIGLGSGIFVNMPDSNGDLFPAGKAGWRIKDANFGNPVTDYIISVNLFAGLEADILRLDGTSRAIVGVGDNLVDLGLTGERFKTLFIGTNVLVGNDVNVTTTSYIVSDTTLSDGLLADIADLTISAANNLFLSAQGTPYSLSATGAALATTATDIIGAINETHAFAINGDELHEVLSNGNLTGGTDLLVSSGDSIGFNSISDLLPPDILLERLSAGELDVSLTSGGNGDGTLRVNIIHSINDLNLSGSDNLVFRTNFTDKWVVNSDGAFSPTDALDNFIDIGTIGTSHQRPRTIYVGSSVVVGDPMFGVSNTINNNEIEVDNGPLRLSTVDAESIFFQTTDIDRWVINSDGHLITVLDNSYDVGAVGASRPRTLYAGTSVVIGDTITIDTNSISGSTNLDISSSGNITVDAPTSINVGKTNASIIDIGSDVAKTTVYDSLDISAAMSTYHSSITLVGDTSSITTGSLAGFGTHIASVLDDDAGTQFNAGKAGWRIVDPAAANPIVDYIISTNVSGSGEVELLTLDGTNQQLILNRETGGTISTVSNLLRFQRTLTGASDGFGTGFDVVLEDDTATNRTVAQWSAEWDDLATSSDAAIVWKVRSENALWTSMKLRGAHQEQTGETPLLELFASWDEATSQRLVKQDIVSINDVAVIPIVGFGARYSVSLLGANSGGTAHGVIDEAARETIYWTTATEGAKSSAHDWYVLQSENLVHLLSLEGKERAVVIPNQADLQFNDYTGGVTPANGRVSVFSRSDGLMYSRNALGGAFDLLMSGIQAGNNGGQFAGGPFHRINALGDLIAADGGSGILDLSVSAGSGDTLDVQTRSFNTSGDVSFNPGFANAPVLMMVVFSENGNSAGGVGFAIGNNGSLSAQANGSMNIGDNSFWIFFDNQFMSNGNSPGSWIYTVTSFTSTSIVLTRSGTATAAVIEGRVFVLGR